MTLQEEIIQCIQDLNVSDAFSKIKEYEEHYGRDEFYYLSMSDLLIYEEMTEEAMILMNEAEIEGYSGPLFYERMGDILYALERYDEALDYLNRCDLGDDPLDDLHILYLYGKIYSKQGKYKEAIQAFEDILLEMNMPTIYLYAAQAYWKVGNEKRAIEYFDRACKDEPSIVYEVCDFFEEEKNEEMFERYFQQMDDPDPGFKIYRHAQFYIQTDQEQKAKEYIEANIDAYPVNILYSQLLSYYEEDNDLKQLKKIESLLLKADPDESMDPADFCELRILIMIKRQYASTTIKKYIKQYMKENSNDEDVYVAIARVLIRMDRPDEAAYLFRNFPFRSTDKGVNDFVGHLQATTYMIVEDYQRAYQVFKNNPFINGIDDEEEKDLCWLQYAAACFGTGHFQEAIDITRPKALSDGGFASLYLMSLNMIEEMSEQQFADMTEVIEEILRKIDNNDYLNAEAVLRTIDLIDPYFDDQEDD